MDHKVLFTRRAFEGKPLWYKIKYSMAHAPEVVYLGVLSFCVIFPAIYAYKSYNQSGSRKEALSKFKLRYTVVRHDDPQIPAIIAEKENGKEHFPKY